MKRLLLVFLIMPSMLHAVCAPRIINPLTHIAWNSIFPIKVAGIPMTPSDQPDSWDAAQSPVCLCPAPVVGMRPGITISLWEPSRILETVKDPYCFPTIGTQLSQTSPGLQQGNAKSDTGVDGALSFYQVHYIIFPIWEILGLFIDQLCLTQGGIDVGYLTELDPLWSDDALSLMLSPEAMLFANPIAQMACIADAASTQFGLPNDALFWCMGSWGSAYPMGGHVTEETDMEAQAAVGAKFLYKLSRQGLLWNEAVNYCTAIPTPIWVKSHLRMQLAMPIRDIQARNIGVTGALWSSLKHPPGMDNFSWIIFKKRACCAL